VMADSDIRSPRSLACAALRFVHIENGDVYELVQGLRVELHARTVPERDRRSLCIPLLETQIEQVPTATSTWRSMFARRFGRRVQRRRNRIPSSNTSFKSCVPRLPRRRKECHKGVFSICNPVPLLDAEIQQALRHAIALPQAALGRRLTPAQEQDRVSRPHQFGRSNRVDSRAPLVCEDPSIVSIR